MSADSFAPQRRSAAACGAGIAALVYGAALTLLGGTLALPSARAAGSEHDGARDDHGAGDRGREHPQAQRAHDREWRQREERQRYEQQHYWRYQRPVYVPPPVYAYPPQASPGVTFVLPLEIRAR